MGEEQQRARAIDSVLLLLEAPLRGGRARGRVDGVTRLEKLLYLAGKEGLSNLLEDPFEFIPYHYGPYSKGIYEAVELLERLDLIREERVLLSGNLDEAEEVLATSGDQEGVERRFVLTEQGTKVAAALKRKFPKAYELLAEIKERYGPLPLSELIRYVYARYPKDAEESLIRDKYGS